MCRQQDETIQHLFNECLMGEQISTGVMQEMQVQVLVQNRVAMIISTGTYQIIRELTLLMHFVTWRERCNRIFNEKTKPNDIVIQEIKTQWRASSLEDQERNFI